MKVNKPYFLLFISIFAVSISSIMIKASTTPPSIAGMYRLFITVLIMLPFVRWKTVRSLQMAPKDWGIVAIAGIFLGLHFLFWMESLLYTSIASSMVILTLQPLFVMIGSYFLFKERITMLSICCMLAAVTGSLIIAWDDIGISRAALIGDGLSLLGTISMAVYMLAGQKVSRNIPANFYSVVVFFIGGIVMLVYSLFNQISLTDYRTADWTYFLMLAIIPTVFGHFLFNYLLTSIGATTVSIGVIGEPVIAIILAYLILGESISVSQFLGGLFTIAGIALYFWAKKNDAKKDAKLKGLSHE